MRLKPRGVRAAGYHAVSSRSRRGSETAGGQFEVGVVGQHEVLSTLLRRRSPRRSLVIARHRGGGVPPRVYPSLGYGREVGPIRLRARTACAGTFMSIFIHIRRGWWYLEGRRGACSGRRRCRRICEARVNILVVIARRSLGGRASSGHFRALERRRSSRGGLVLVPSRAGRHVLPNDANR